jgi:hypothetical protein
MLEIKQYFKLPLTLPNSDAELQRELPAWLAAASARGRVVLLIAGLDRIRGSQTAEPLAWLPAALPPNVRLVGTCASSPAASRGKIHPRKIPS